MYFDKVKMHSVLDVIGKVHIYSMLVKCKKVILNALKNFEYVEYMPCYLLYSSDLLFK